MTPTAYSAKVESDLAAKSFDPQGDGTVSFRAGIHIQELLAAHPALANPGGDAPPMADHERKKKARQLTAARLYLMSSDF